MENEIIMNEETIEQVTEVVASKPGMNWGKMGLGVLAIGAVVALGCRVYQICKAKNAKDDASEEEAVEANAGDHDFVDA